MISRIEDIEMTIFGKTSSGGILPRVLNCENGWFGSDEAKSGGIGSRLSDLEAAIQQ